MDDVDKLVLKSMDVNYLQYLCGSIVDLANVPVRSRDAIGLGVPIVSSPVYVFINGVEKQRFADALAEWSGVSSFLTAHQHIKGYFVPSRLLCM